MKFKRRLQYRVGIDMTPMIDSVFLLLIFFMITSSIIKDQGIQVALPHAKSAESQPDRDLVISISREGAIFLNDAKVAKKDLYQKLRKVYKEAKRDFLIIRADEVIEYGVLVEVMDIARLAGIYNVSLSTKR
ncbi:MAG TPA: biopolymer transporter ExbD [Spirochaetota bacterium]|nr:biopolymer transporter ExbD [Spirochaetota bacterium]HPH01626.1 biopolymer transporter ExbD [Spirochaetota bacterium]